MEPAEQIVSQILEALEGKPTRAAIHAAHRLVNLVGADHWKIDATYWASAVKVLKWGFPLNLFGESALLRPFLSRMGRSIRRDGAPNENDFAEISGMALLIANGAAFPESVPRNVDKSQDLIVQFGGENIEVEVTRADTKQKHREAVQLASKLVDRLFPLLRDKDIVVHIRDIFDRGAHNAIWTAYHADPNREFTQREGEWTISNAEVARDTNVLFAAGVQDTSPNWWPQRAVHMFSIRGTLVGPRSQKASPQVRVRFTAPVAGYLNTAIKKARRFQGSRTRSFLIALDVTNLPNAFDVFRFLATLSGCRAVGR